MKQELVKSFIVKSLGFLLGEKLQANLVRNGADHAQVEARFIINDKEIFNQKGIGRGKRKKPSLY